MIRETLTAIGQAGRQALQQIVPRTDVRTQVTQVREWSFAMPDLGLVTVANSPVHQIYVGLSRPLSQAVDRVPAGHEALLETFKDALVARIPARRPIGSWQILPPDGEARVLRGVRSFILRQQTEAGNLYLMADVASRGEFESMRQDNWEQELANSLLPKDIARIDCIEDPAEVQRLMTYLSRFEHDLELLIPGNDGNVHSCNGVFMRRGKRGEQPLMQLSVDLDREMRDVLQPGLELEGSFGAGGRVFRFRTACAGPGPLALESIAELPCFNFQTPARFHLDQRRRYFRVRPEGVLTARVMVLPPETVGKDGEQGVVRPPASPPEDALTAQVCDLSFSGAGLVLDSAAPEGLQQDGLVHMWLDGPELTRTLELTGLVRRLSVTPQGRGRSELGLGIEFLVRRASDKQSTQAVRQYVMAQQRRLLSSRSALV